MGERGDTIKTRQICFHGPHRDPAQARTAMRVLEGADGIIDARAMDPQTLCVTYDVRKITLQLIEQALAELGFHLDNSVLTQIRRALYYYCEDVQAAQLGCRRGNCTQAVFITQYRQRPHGCRDQRPECWRHYL